MKLEAIWQEMTQLEIFREIMDAMARPGTIRNISDCTHHRMPYRAVIACLMDSGLTLHDPARMLDDTDWHLLQIEPDVAQHADFILCNGMDTPEFTPKLGTLSSPELSATIIVHVEQIGSGNSHLILSGPGIPETQSLSLQGLHNDWIVLRNQWVADFPLGIDMVICDQERIVALPRTTRMEVQ